MSSIRKNARYILVAFGVAVALPVALTIASDVAQASGYMVASGIIGEVVCTQGGLSDCPDGGVIGGGDG